MNRRGREKISDDEYESIGSGEEGSCLHLGFDRGLLGKEGVYYGLPFFYTIAVLVTDHIRSVKGEDKT